MIRILTCTTCALTQPADDTTPCPRCGAVTWLDFPHLDTPDDLPESMFPGHPVVGQTVGTVSTLWRYDGIDWIPVARRPKGPRP